MYFLETFVSSLSKHLEYDAASPKYLHEHNIVCKMTLFVIDFFS